MTFRPISDCLPAWLVDEIEKMAAAVEAAAQVNREVITEAETLVIRETANRPHMRPALRVISSRDRPAHNPRAKPPLGAGQSLRLVVNNAHQTSSGARVSSR